MERFFIFFTHTVWLEGPHQGKVRKIKGGGVYPSAQEALDEARRLGPVGHVYRHGSTGRRNQVIDYSVKEVF